jgi:hypothetical protein
MALRASKPSFNVREKLTELGRRFGLKGSQLAAAETVQEARDLVSAGRKNALYNGDMQIWQRGTTFNNGGGGAVVNYTADRWNSTRYASSENDVSREDANYLGFRYCLRSARGGGDTATTARFVHQVLEQKDTWKLRGNYVTFSFYLRVGSGFNGGLMKSSITYHTDSAREERFHYDQFQNGNNTKSQIEHKSLSTDWQRFTHTTYIPDNAQQVGVAIASNENLQNAVSADYFEMTGCQLEVGRNATDFEHRSYGEELALCQRYYFKLSNSRLVAGYKRHDTSSNFQMGSPVPMRVEPDPTLLVSGSFTNMQTNFNTTQSSPNVYQWDGHSFMFQVASTWSSTHTFIPSWEGFTAEFDSEL